MEEKQLLPPLLAATLDPGMSLAELLQAHMALAGDTTGATTGLLVRQIAAQLHVDPKTISNWLKGRHRPHDDMVQDLVDTLATLIPIPAGVENRPLILEKQRKAIYAACQKRVAPPVEVVEDMTSAKEAGSSSRQIDLASRPLLALPVRQPRKLAFSMGALGVVAVFSVLWAASGSSAVVVPFEKQAGHSVLIGGFEEPALTEKGKGTLYFPQGQTWKIWGNNGGGIQRNYSGWGGAAAPEGEQTAFMHSGDVHMSREIRIEPGVYNISVYAARRPYGKENPNPFQILVNGKELSDLITPEDTQFKRYQSHDFTVPAATTYTIEIATRSREARFGDTFVDKVELNTVAAASGGNVLKHAFEVLDAKMRDWGL